MDKLNTEIGAEIKRLRIAKGMTQRQLGDAISTIQANISLLEKGRLNPSVQYLEKVAVVLGIEVKELFKNI